MCFFTKKNQFKIAEKPIRVYKWLRENGRTPFQYYTYHKGLNFPESATVEDVRNIQTAHAHCYFGGVLHCFKRKQKTDSYRIIIMYIPVGARYNDEGIGGSHDEIISTALYWPKNIVERIWYYFTSKKY